MAHRPSHPDPPATIDVLLLRTLANQVPTTAEELAAIWGEDRVRVEDWLSKFVSLGLAVSLFKGSEFVGIPQMISVYLENRKSGILGT